MIVYLVLHYKSIETTIQCVDSIADHMSFTSRIVIVNNGSGKEAHEMLKAHYENGHFVEVVSINNNCGYACGNNYGYSYIKEKYSADFIVICNNDTVFEQDDFEQEIINAKETTGFDICGPDIVNLEGVHQNPRRINRMSLGQIRIQMIRKRLVYVALILNQYVHCVDLCRIQDEFDAKRVAKRTSIESPRFDCVLQGSCIIVSKSFIDAEKVVFDPRTFLYYEEDILAMRCNSRGYRLCYWPNIKIIHKEGISTKSECTNILERRINLYKRMIESLKICEKVYKENNVKDNR